ncbi:MAG: hypothetical protein KIS30_04910 [Thermoplasmata archaeon]|nr:hypothetical protein [Candidatus Sysuiplasma acidicola]MBX8646080.1 hypothetical protein [Candidatus Sysuiplasma acidicola]MDH2905532.1 hypothetical protein [Methanomassiliicoccales archaeon]
MNGIVLFLTFLVLGFSLMLFIVSVISLLRVKSAKTALLSVAFGFYFLKEVFMLYLALTQGAAYSYFLLLSGVLDLAVLLFFYAAVFK